MVKLIKPSPYHVSWPHPVTIFIILAMIVLLVPSILMPYWYTSMKKVIHDIEVDATSNFASKIDHAAKLMVSSNSSAAKLASMLASNEKLSFSQVQSKVAFVLFEDLLITPYLSQASYVGFDGLFFSYYIDDDGNMNVAYCNSSFMMPNASSTAPSTWYTQPVNSINGELYGEAKTIEPFTINQTWFHSAMNNSKGFASLGFSWSNKGVNEPDMFLDSSRVGEAGVISLGFSVKEITSVFSNINLNGGSLYIATNDDYGKVLLQGIKGVKMKSEGDKTLALKGNTDKVVGEISCKSQNASSSNGAPVTLTVRQTEFIFHCAHINIVGVPSVYVLAFPSKGELVRSVYKHTNVALIFLIVMMVAISIYIFSFVALLVRAAWREVHLCAAYMRQIDKTSQAERKALKQSLAFASANHDVRGYLACIKGLIDLCYIDVPPNSELASNFKKIDTCAAELLALVTSIVDFSKIEAGKMQLDDEEFDLEKLLEDITDIHHPVALRKGIDLILDPCDSSIMKFSSVRGDRIKLKQILGNLLSNAVKYTPSGYISIRAWSKKPSLENSIIASNKNTLLNRLSHIFYKNKQAYNDLEEMRMIKQDSNCMEFVFEVEDTGLGIPKDKRESIFENFVQVKENSVGQLGTGLGLGIVQSLVRLMGGDIEIFDKANGEVGTCFRFNIFLIVKDNVSQNCLKQCKPEFGDGYASSELRSYAHSPRHEGSIVVLLMKNGERRRMVQRYMENMGINVVVVRQVSRIHRVLKNKVKYKLTNASQYCSSSSGACSPRSRRKLMPLNLLDDTDDNLPVQRKSSHRGTVKCIMLIIDANAGDFQEMCRSVAQLRKDLSETCIKVVWLERPDTRKSHFSGLLDECLPLTDCIMLEPLHGSRLFKVIELLPEFGGELPIFPRGGWSSNRVFTSHPCSDGEEIHSSSSERSLSRTCMTVMSRTNYGEIEEVSASCKKSSTGMICSSPSNVPANILATESQKNNAGSSSSSKPLEGKTFLVADDNHINRKIVSSLVTRLGGLTEVCENGREAFELICKALNNLNNNGFPYDYVLMDCQMPIMDGFEATRKIREEERKYGIHIPVIALTADDAQEAGHMIFEAGMDLHLTKPLKKDELVEAVALVSSWV